MKRLGKLLLFLAQSAVIGLAAAFVIVFFKPDLLRNSGNLPQDSYASAVGRSSVSVVNINSAKRVPAPVNPFANDPVWQRFFGSPYGAPPTRLENSLGSGVIVSAKGYVLTNYHVIKGAEEIQVGLQDGRSASAKVVGVDPDTDLALLKIGLGGVKSIPMGRSDTLKIGDIVLAIGDPFGVGQTVTQGIISATGRSQLGLSTFENFIQTDAAINPGNSGGALINIRGELIGINTAMFSPSDSSSGIGFAIPVNLARGVMQQLIAYGRVRRGWLGVATQDISSKLADAFGISSTRGFVIVGVQPDGPADKAGIRVGDIITAIDHAAVVDSRSALNRIASEPPGTRITLTGVRNHKTFEATAITAERPIQQNS